MTQQPLSNGEILDLCFQIAKILQNNDESKSSIESEIEKAIKAKIIESHLEKYILIPKYKSL
jgi:hypothetical protein